MPGGPGAAGGALVRRPVAAGKQAAPAKGLDVRGGEGQLRGVGRDAVQGGGVRAREKRAGPGAGGARRVGLTGSPGFRFFFILYFGGGAFQSELKVQGDARDLPDLSDLHHSNSSG